MKKKKKMKKTEGTNELSKNSENAFQEWVMKGVTYAEISDLWKDVKKDIKKYAGAYTFLITVLFFVMRGYWYIYTCGHFDALKIDRCYLRSDGDTPLFSIMACVGLGIAWAFLNYLMYNIIQQKRRGVALILFLVEYGICMKIVCEMTNSSIGEMFTNSKLVDVLVCLLMIFWVVVMINYFGFFIPICMWGQRKMKIWKKANKIEKGIEQNAESEEPDKKYNIREIGISAGIVLISFGIAVYFLGRNMSANQINYKVIEQKDIENNTGDANAYVVLHETDEEYIVAPLYKENNKVIKDIDEQDVLPKQGIRTKYYSDIQSVEIGK